MIEPLRMPRTRSRKLKWLGCIKYSKNGRSYVDKKKLDQVTGYIRPFSKSQLDEAT